MVSESRDRSPDRRDRRDHSSGPRRSGGPSRFSGGGAAKPPTGGARRAPPERRVFISNIPFEMKWQEIKDLFREEAAEVSYVELFNDENDKPRGCGIIEFNTESEAKLAVEKMHRHEYKGRKLVVKEDFENERDKHGRIIGSKGGPRGGDRDRNRDRDRREMSSSMGGGVGSGNTYGLSPQFLESLGIDGPLHTRLFVANLSYDVDERKLREVFRLAGRVVMVELNRDKEGKSRGHGTIEYDHPVEAVQAISMFSQQSLYDRKMTVRFDKSPGPTPEEMAQLPSRLPEGLEGVGMGLGSGGNPLTEVAKNLPGSDATASGNAMAAQAGAARNTGASGLNVMDVVRTLQVAKQLDMMGGGNGLGNLLSGGSAGMSNNMGGNMMAPAGGMAPSNMSGTSSIGGNAGMGAGSMSARPMGAGPMGAAPMGAGPMGGSSMGGSSMSGGPSMNSSMGGMSAGPSMSDYDRTSMSDMGSRGPPSGYNTTTAPTGRGRDREGSSSGYGRGNMPESSQMRPFDTIIVRNLPMDCNWQVMREGFSHCGEIKFAEMKERGSGIIRFANERDAERAISMMHKQTVAGRVIDVRPY